MDGLPAALPVGALTTSVVPPLKRKTLSSDVKATTLSAPITGSYDAQGRCCPSPVMLIRSVTDGIGAGFCRRSPEKTNTSDSALVSPGTRWDAVELNATARPLSASAPSMTWALGGRAAPGRPVRRSRTRVPSVSETTA